ncbi:MAG TPA: (d)CMP kinase [Actinomycetes bacterium]|jgi:cytidylate kinase|nr:(d)CMP kinase [Actinomycetes bacterium]
MIMEELDEGQHTHDDVVVAIDGPAGSGKSTVARAVAERVDLRHLDTGAIYRALTLALLRQGVTPEDADAVAVAAKSADLALELAPGRSGAVRVLLDGSAMGEELRSAEVSRAVSAVSAVPAVREQLVALQRAVISLGGIVAEGRDIGAVVWPQAEVKVFLTADAAERARRRADGESAEALARRDRLDSDRAASPTRAAPDALVIDSTGREVGDIVEEVVDLIASARAGRDR